MIPGIQSAINGLLGMNLVVSWYDFKPMQQHWDVNWNKFTLYSPSSKKKKLSQIERPQNL